MTVLERLKKMKKKQTLTTLKKILKIKTEEESDALIQELYHLELEGKIYYDEYGYISVVPREFYLAHGILKKSHRQNYYIKTKENTYLLIPNKDLNHALISDTVFVEKTSQKKNSNIFYGRIIRVVKPISKKKESFMSQGKIEKDEHENYYLYHEGEKYEIPKQKLNGAYVGDYVSAYFKEQQAFVINIMKRANETHVFEYLNGKWHPLGTEFFPIEINIPFKVQNRDRILAKVPCEKQEKIYHLTFVKKISSQNFIDGLVKEHGFSPDFPDPVLESSKTLNQVMISKENRIDLRNLITFTIDPNDAKDLDDAISLQKDHDCFRLYVHIADVDAYVKYQTPLYYEGLKRGVSCYPANQVIPMFPPILSEDLCSLNTKKAKYTKTIEIKLNNEGQTLDYAIYPSIIHSNIQMSYEKVNELLEKEKIPPSYLPYASTLKEMYKLALKLKKQRISRGTQIFQTFEKKYLLNEENFPIFLEETKHGPAEQIIESFMLLANELTASYAYWLEIPFVYRNHNRPERKDLYTLKAHLKEYSNQTEKIEKLSDPKYLQHVFFKLLKGKTPEEIHYISTIFLNSMTRAYYEEIPRGHYGLGLERYATITSPIRKGSDFLNHFILGEVLNGNIDSPVLEEISMHLHQLCMHFTERQIAEEQLENDVQRILTQEYISQIPNEPISAQIIFMMPHYLIVKTPQNLTGIVTLDQRFLYQKSSLICDLSGNNYQIGDIISVKIKSINPKNGELELEFIKKELERRKNK